MSAKKNYLYSFICEFITTLIPFITLPYVSRVIGTQGVGEYTYAFTWAYYFMLAGRLGIRVYGNRAIARVRDDKDKLSKTFIEIYAMQLMVCVATLILYILFAGTAFHGQPLFIIVALMVLSTCFEIDWFYYGVELIKYTALRTIAIHALTAAAIFCFVKSKQDVWVYALISGIGMLAGEVALFVNLRRYISFSRPSFKKILTHVKPNLILFAPTIATGIYRDMDKLMLGKFSSFSQLGLYENAIKLQTCLLTFVTSINAVMLPRISNLVSRGMEGAAEEYLQNSGRLVIILASAIAFGVGGVAVEFAPFYFGSAFAQSGILMMWLTPTILFVCFSGFIRSQYIIPYGRDKIYLITSISGAVINFSMNLVLIPRLGAFGAVIGTIAAELTVVVLQYIYLRKVIDYKNLLLPNLPFIAFGILMFIGTRWIASFGMAVLTTLIIQITAGAAFYLTASLLYLIISGDRVLIPQLKKMLAVCKLFIYKNRKRIWRNMQ